MSIVRINVRSLGEMNLCSHFLYQNRPEIHVQNKTANPRLEYGSIGHLLRPGAIIPTYVELVQINEEEESNRKMGQKT